jgi:hypothetical protein
MNFKLRITDIHRRAFNRDEKLCGRRSVSPNNLAFHKSGTRTHDIWREKPIS